MAAEREPRVAGVKQVLRALDKGVAASVLLAEDADPALRESVERKAMEAGVTVTRVSSMAALGKMCGLSVPAAAAAPLKTAED